MATTNRWAIRDVATASFFDLVTGKLKVKLDSLKTSGLENTSEIVYVQGGSGNPKLVGFSGSRAARFTLQDALFSNDMIAMMLGTDVVTGAVPVTVNEALTVTSNAATLEYTPTTTGALKSVNKLLADGTISDPLIYTASTPTTGQYKVTGKSISLFAGDVATGGKILAYYETTAGADTKQLKAQTNKFAGSYKLILDVLVRDFFTKQDFYAQIVIPSAKIEDSFNLTMAPDGDPSVLDIPMEALAVPGTKDLYTMYIFDESELA
jgi:hypothetical protein